MKSALWFLTLVNLLNYLDRFIISSAATKIEAEFSLSRAQTGLVMSAFMIGYMVTSPIFGWMADRGQRPKLMGAGVFVWSLATALTGWVSSFVPLLIARVFVGVGEASYATIAPAYIRDSIKDERQVNRAISFFYTAIPVGAALGYMWGGYMSEHHSWRWAFYIGALPGLILGGFVYLMKDPDHSRSAEGTGAPVNLNETAKLLWRNREYRLTVLGYTAHTFGLGGFAAWAPYYSANFLNVPLTEASFKIGIVTVVAGVVGTLIGGKWGDRFIKGESRGAAAARAFNKFSALSSLAAFPFAVWMLLAGSMNEFMVALLLVQVALFASLSPINTATLAAVPGSITATAFAVQIFVIHALGDVISPPLVGMLADRMPMNQAMAVLPVAIGVSAVVWWNASRPGTVIEQRQTV